MIAGAAILASGAILATRTILATRSIRTIRLILASVSPGRPQLWPAARARPLSPLLTWPPPPHTHHGTCAGGVILVAERPSSALAQADEWTPTAGNQTLFGCSKTPPERTDTHRHEKHTEQGVSGAFSVEVHAVRSKETERYEPKEVPLHKHKRQILKCESSATVRGQCKGSAMAV